QMIVRRVSYFTFIVAITTLASVGACSQAKAAAAHAADDSGSPGYDGISVCAGELERALQDLGLVAGTFKITREASDHENAVRLYLVISKDYKGQVSAKIFKAPAAQIRYTCHPFGEAASA